MVNETKECDVEGLCCEVHGEPSNVIYIKGSNVCCKETPGSVEYVRSEHAQDTVIHLLENNAKLRDSVRGGVSAFKYVVKKAGYSEFDIIRELLSMKEGEDEQCATAGDPGTPDRRDCAKEDCCKTEVSPS